MGRPRTLRPQLRRDSLGGRPMCPRTLVAVGACVAVLACGDGLGPRRATVSGLLLDSLANRPVDSQFVFWRVGSTLDSMKTNQAGEFMFEIPTGSVRLTYSDFARYEDFDRTITVQRDTAIVLRVRRTLPFLRDFSVTAAGILQATIVDLQGAATVAQDQGTWVVYDYGLVTQSSAIQAPQWTLSPVDALTWRVSVATGSTSITNAYWNVMDDRYPTGFLCQAGQAACVPDAP